MPADLPGGRLPPMVPFEEAAELQDGGLIRHRLPAEVDADEGPHGLGIIQRVFRPRIGEAEPRREEVTPEHALEPHRGPAVLALGIRARSRRTDPARAPPSPYPPKTSRDGWASCGSRRCRGAKVVWRME